MISPKAATSAVDNLLLQDPKISSFPDGCGRIQKLNVIRHYSSFVFHPFITFAADLVIVLVGLISTGCSGCGPPHLPPFGSFLDVLDTTFGVSELIELLNTGTLVALIV